MTVAFLSGCVVGGVLGAFVMAVVTAGARAEPQRERMGVVKGETELDTWQP